MVEREGAALTVIASAMGRWAAVLLGSVSSTLVRSAWSPLVVVPRTANEPPHGTTSPRRIA